MNINEIVVLTTFARYDYLKRSDGARRAADLYRAPTFDKDVANSVIGDLLDRDLLEQNGFLLRVTSRGLVTLKKNYSELDGIASATQQALLKGVS